MKIEKNKKIAFLDRDGVINKCAPEHEYITSAKDFKFNSGIFNLLNLLKEHGYEFIVITNQRGIDRGLLTQESLILIHKKMIEELIHRGIVLLDIFYCPHQINSCTCRKPEPGMLITANEKYSIDLSLSLLISDSEADVEMGKKFGIKKSILVPKNNPEAALIVLNL